MNVCAKGILEQEIPRPLIDFISSIRFEHSETILQAKDFLD